MWRAPVLALSYALMVPIVALLSFATTILHSYSEPLWKVSKGAVESRVARCCVLFCSIHACWYLLTDSDSSMQALQLLRNVGVLFASSGWWQVEAIRSHRPWEAPPPDGGASGLAIQIDPALAQPPWTVPLQTQVRRLNMSYLDLPRVVWGSRLLKSKGMVPWKLCSRNILECSWML